ncbi:MULTISPECIES: TetR/AcrR family transcriptional regulator [Mycobacterium]|uniref:TetR family transcriptional regulator n=1 Tax=Mycobacterium kiyosense TaxID=2871094 RepID=A0A9P3UZ88_9MYCO|nr:MULTISPECIES: TetR/AcrR family transcriptional regulator [Mycobacterium]BDB43757.1 TetR family transcriptional regulator [Mycobacterium kiyosense]BDE15322.1 TetR family transcriptional regulator [Mycobacterium sp. 20KCMC460]GLB83984.1 TetR family transcriptional regulator [Mycobacterium kiyosense]GLB91490.1 TetR family transcriptional regulator [Mycobacterium kiyosense]GLB97367.1 TetR family transcriptional regulator [Mycobacterium kiyosense]
MTRARTDRRAPQRGDQRREAILDALEKTLQEHDFDDVNIAEVAARAGVTRPAFYFYFESKASAVAALMERMVDDTMFVNDIFTMSDCPPRERVRGMLEGLFDTWERHRSMFKAALQARGHSAAGRRMWDDGRATFVESVAGMIRAERVAGTAPEGIDATILATVLLEVNDRMLERMTLGGPLNRTELLDGAAAIWLGAVYGIVAEPTR